MTNRRPTLRQQLRDERDARQAEHDRRVAQMRCDLLDAAEARGEVRCPSCGRDYEGCECSADEGGIGRDSYR